MVQQSEHQKRHFHFEIILIFVILIIFVLTLFAKHYPYFAFDLYITRLIQEVNNPVFNLLMTLVSWMGNVYQAIVSLIIGSLLFLYFKKKDWAAGLIFSAVGAVTIAETLKRIVNRPRPDPSLIHQIEKFTRDDSFPSGHVLLFMGFYGFLLFVSFVSIKNKLWRNLVCGFLFCLLILIGISRIYRGSHWFSDTLASYLIGSVWLYLVVLILRKIKLQSK